MFSAENLIQWLPVAMVSVITFFAKRSLNDIANGINRNDLAIKKLEKEFHDFKNDLPFIYVIREDFVRTLNNVDTKMSSIEAKLDKMIMQCK